MFTPEDLVSTSSSPPNWHRIFLISKAGAGLGIAGRDSSRSCTASFSVATRVYEQEPWVAASLFDAFERAKAAGTRACAISAPALAIPDLPQALRDLDELFDGDRLRYGYAANARILEAMTQYSFEQGLAARKVDPSELFAPELVDVKTKTRS